MVRILKDWLLLWISSTLKLNIQNMTKNSWPALQFYRGLISIF